MSVPFSIAFLENTLFNCSSNITKSAKGTELTNQLAGFLLDMLMFCDSVSKTVWITVCYLRATTSKKYVFLGQPFGKVAVYIAVNDAGDKERYVGYTFYYEKNGEKWSMTESGACSGTECQIRGRQLDHKK